MDVLFLPPPCKEKRAGSLAVVSCQKIGHGCGNRWAGRKIVRCEKKLDICKKFGNYVAAVLTIGDECFSLSW
jgi:hypothetical protein